MKKMLFTVSLVCCLLFVTPVFAGLPVSVKSDLTRIVISIKNNSGDTFDLVMKEGVAWWPNKKKEPCGFFTYTALKKVWKEKNLKLRKPVYNTSCFPGGLAKGLFLVVWDEKTMEGTAIPVMFNFLGVGMDDGEGGYWHNGQVWISQNSDQWLVKGKPIFWQP